MKRVNGGKVPDFKDAGGFWVRSYTEVTGGVRYQYYTRAGMLWNSIVSRCNPLGAEQKRNAAYRGTINKFKDFQTFADWCQTQHGYLYSDNGEYWPIDKDLIQPGCKTYSEETCCFISKAANTVLLSCRVLRGDYPVGVHKDHNSKSFIAQCSGNVPRWLGAFSTPLEAHRAWQKAKLSQLTKTLEDSRLGTEAVVAFNNMIAKIQTDFKNGEETLC